MAEADPPEAPASAAATEAPKLFAQFNPALGETWESGPTNTSAVPPGHVRVRALVYKGHLPGPTPVLACTDLLMPNTTHCEEIYNYVIQSADEQDEGLCGTRHDETRAGRP